MTGARAPRAAHFSPGHAHRLQPGRSERAGRGARGRGLSCYPRAWAGATLGRWGEIKRGKVLQLQIREAQLRYQRLCRVSRLGVGSSCFKAPEL